MNKRVVGFVFLSWGIMLTGYSQRVNTAAVFEDAQSQTRVMLDEIKKTTTAQSDWVSPRTLEKEHLKMVKSGDWTSGFFPGVLWYLYEFTGKPQWEQAARKFTAAVEKEKLNGSTHDMGFKIYCSFGNGYRITKDPKYRAVILEAASTLSTRFNKKAGVLRSWDHNKQKWDFPVIIDNMLNLELLFEASKLSGNKKFYEIAVSHANQTMANHFRPDYSSYHVVDYDSITGKVIKKTTHQGYSDASAWSRGQAWGLYGYTMCYRETRDPKYLKQAEKIAGFMLNHPNLPKDKIPYWDYNAPQIPQEPRDVSAAAVMASALLELSTYSKNGVLYKQTAETVLSNLTQHYRPKTGDAKGFLLLESTGSKPSNSEVNVPLVYADYYYVEALLRLLKLEKQKKMF